MVFRIGKVISTIGGAIGKNAKQLTNYRMDRQTAGCLTFFGALAIPTVFCLLTNNCQGYGKPQGGQVQNSNSNKPNSVMPNGNSVTATNGEEFGSNPVGCYEFDGKPLYDRDLQNVRRGETGDTIGNVAFQKGLVKTINAGDHASGFGMRGTDITVYTVGLQDGSELNFVPQYATNKAEVGMENGELIFKGIKEMYFNHENENSQMSNLGKYKFLGCTGFVNTEGKDGEMITLAHRKMADGTVQKSYMSFCDGSKYSDDAFRDIYLVTENDRPYRGN